MSSEKNTKKLKVLHIITRLDVGGSSTNTIETVARLDKSQYETTLVYGTTYDPDGKIIQNLNGRKIKAVFFPDLVREIDLWKDIKAFIKLRAFIKREKFDVVHTHTSKAGILGRWAAKLAGTRLIIHTPHGHIFYGYFGRVLTAFFIMLERITGIITDQIITLTNIGCRDHLKFKIAPEHKFTTIPSGIDIAQLCGDLSSSQNREIYKIPSDALVFGAVTRLEPIKGNIFLIKAMAEIVKKHSHVRLMIVGDGSQKQYLEEQCRSLNIEDFVVFTGYKPDVVSLFSVMDVFVLSSLNEGMGRVILEAMCLGKPVIATQTGGVPELIQDGFNGILVPPADSPRLAQAMDLLISSPDTRRSLSQKGKETVNQKFSIEKMVLDIQNLYKRLECSSKI